MTVEPLLLMIVTYAAFLVAAAVVVERLPIGPPGRGRGEPGAAWPHDEARRFQAGIARLMLLVAAFLLAAVLLRYRDSLQALLPALALVGVGLRLRGLTPRRPRRSPGRET